MLGTDIERDSLIEEEADIQLLLKGFEPGSVSSISVEPASQPKSEPEPEPEPEPSAAADARAAQEQRLKQLAKKLSEEVPTARTQPTAGGFAEAFFEKRQRVKRLALAAKAAKKEAKRMEHKALHEEVRRRAVAQTRQRLAGATLGSNIYAYCEAARGD